MQRAFSARPFRASRAAVEELRALQPLWNSLYDRVGRDHRFLRHALAEPARHCEWEARQLAVHAHVHERASEKPQLLLPNSVYLPAEGGSWVHTVGNVQAGEPYQLQLVHSLQSEEHAEVCGGPLDAVCDAISTAARLVHPRRPTVAVLSKPAHKLALRTRADVRGVGAKLQRDHGVAEVLYVSMADLAAARVIVMTTRPPAAAARLTQPQHHTATHAHVQATGPAHSRPLVRSAAAAGHVHDTSTTRPLQVDAAGELRLGGTSLSLIYSRFDFSHPSGAFHEEAVLGASAGRGGGSRPRLGRTEPRLRGRWAAAAAAAARRGASGRPWRRSSVRAR